MFSGYDVEGVGVKFWGMILGVIWEGFPFCDVGAKIFLGE